MDKVLGWLKIANAATAATVSTGTVQGVDPQMLLWNGIAHIVISAIHEALKLWRNSKNA